MSNQAISSKLKTVGDTIQPFVTNSDVNLTANGTGSIALTSTGTSATAIALTATTGAGGIDINAGTGGIDIETTGAMSIDSAGGVSNITHTATAAGDFTIEMDGAVDASLILRSTGTGADALQVTTTAGGIDITNGGAAGEDLDITSTNASLNLTAGEAAADAIVLNASNAAGGIDIDAGTSGITVDTTGPLSMDSAGTSSNISHAGATAGDFTIEMNSANDASLILRSTGTAADALQITTTAGGIDITNGGAAGEDIDITSTNASLNLTAGEGVASAISIQATAAGAGIDIDAGTGGITIDSAATTSSALHMHATAGGVDMDAAAGFDIDLSGGQVLISSKDNVASAVGITTNNGTTETIVVTNTQGTAEGAITLTATAGGVDIDAAATKNIDLSGGQVLISSKDDAASAISLTANVGTSETIVVTNTQGTGSGAVELTATAGGVDINAGAGVTIDATGGAISLDSSAASNFTAGGILTLSTTSGNVFIDPFSGVIDAGTSTISNVVDPTSAQDAATKNYVDNVAQGLDVKDSSRLATTTTLAANSSTTGTVTYNNTAGTISATLGVSDTFTVDGVTLSSADDGARVLVKNENAAEITSITVVAKASITDGEYFDIEAIVSGSATGYRVWFDTDGNNDSAPEAGGNTLVRVNISGDTTAADVAATLQSVLDDNTAAPTGAPGLNAVVSGAVVTVCNAETGAVTTATDSVADAGFVISVVQAGSASDSAGSAHNGIYTTTISGTSLTLTRATDQDGTPSNEVSAGNFTFVEQGTQASAGFTLIGDTTQNNGIITLGANTLNWTQFSSAAALSAGDGIDIGSNIVSVDLKANGGLVIESTELAVDLSASSITGTLAVADGGTGQTTYTNGQLLIGNTTGNTLTKATLTGTASRLSVTNGTGSITLDIDSSYVGQTSITTLGTITTGTWNGTAIAVGNGGTGATTLTDGGVLLGSGTGAITALGQATNGQLVIGSTGGDPVLATLTGGAGITVTNGAGSITVASDLAGLWTPAVSITTNPTQISVQGTGSGALTTSGASGYIKYIKVGNLLVLSIDLQFTIATTLGVQQYLRLDLGVTPGGALGTIVNGRMVLANRNDATVDFTDGTPTIFTNCDADIVTDTNYQLEIYSGIFTESTSPANVNVIQGTVYLETS